MKKILELITVSSAGKWSPKSNKKAVYINLPNEASEQQVAVDFSTGEGELYRETEEPRICLQFSEYTAWSGTMEELKKALMETDRLIDLD